MQVCVLAELAVHHLPWGPNLLGCHVLAWKLCHRPQTPLIYSRNNRPV